MKTIFLRIPANKTVHNEEQEVTGHKLVNLAHIAYVNLTSLIEIGLSNGETFSLKAVNHPELFSFFMRGNQFNFLVIALDEPNQKQKETTQAITKNQQELLDLKKKERVAFSEKITF